VLVLVLVVPHLGTGLKEGGTGLKEGMQSRAKRRVLVVSVLFEVSLKWYGGIPGRVCWC
jgi:hypothetical protein